MKAFNIFDKCVKALVVILIIVMTSVEFLQILIRFIFKAPFSWPEELVRYLFIWVTFMTIGLAIDHNRFATFDLLVKKIPPKAMKPFKTMLLLIAITFFVMMTVVGFKAVANNVNIRSSAMRIRFSYVVLGVPAGSIVAIIYALKDLILLWKASPETKKEETA